MVSVMLVNIPENDWYNLGRTFPGSSISVRHNNLNETFSDHIITIKAVFDRLRWSGESLIASKCEFGRSKIDFLGYELSKKGIRPQKRLTEAIDSFDRPTSRKEIQRFLGLLIFTAILYWAFHKLVSR